LTDAEFVIRGLSVGVPIGLVLAGLLQLVDQDSTLGEFWQGFKDEMSE